MSSRPTPSWLFSALILGLSLGLVGLTTPPSARAATPDFRVVGLADPIKVDLGEENLETVYWSPRVTTDDVTVTYTTSAGLELLNGPSFIHDRVRARRGSDDLLLRASTPGFHDLVIEISAPGRETLRATFRYVWAPGGPIIDGGGSLAGHYYAEEDAIGGLAESDSRYNRMLGFIDDRWAYTQMPGSGVPARCNASRNECVPYAYDPATQIVQVGDEVINGSLADRIEDAGRRLAS